MRLSRLLLPFFLLCSPWACASDFYLGVNLGALDQSGEFRLVDSTLYPDVGIDSEKNLALPDEVASSVSLLAGYKLSRDMALEAGFVRNDKVKGEYRAISATERALEETETSYLYAALVGVWPVNGGWAFNARLGVAIWDMDYTQLVYDASVTDPVDAETSRVETLSDTTSATLLGIGVSYGLTSSLEIKLGLETHLAEFAFTNLELENDLHLLQLGLAYHF
ncbi:MAG TPA: outer membrane beta-barrel protein [Gammaproteobacteria bacterium]